jgi:hypothetical protein
MDPYRSLCKASKLDHCIPEANLVHIDANASKFSSLLRCEDWSSLLQSTACALVKVIKHEHLKANAQRVSFGADLLPGGGDLDRPCKKFGSIVYLNA